ncbi:MAG TPA: Rieske (2Fe-2S) protein [Acidimicrobiales bacterium]|jgi:nitrite reductase/ring-hydroxylating ferredoxin subunit
MSIDHESAPVVTAPEAGTPTGRMVQFGSRNGLVERGQLVGKVDEMPVVVLWADGRAWAIEDRCPHMGFPLHRGTVADGLLTCHWHHARFDLASGCTLDLWADDATGFDVTIGEVTDGDADVLVSARPSTEGVAALERRLEEGLRDNLSLVITKAVHRLLARGVPPKEVVEIGLRYGAANRDPGWGPGMTVAQVALNLLPHVPPAEQGRAISQALSFLASDTAGHGPFFRLAPLGDGVTAEPGPDQLGRWYRRFVDTRSSQAAERVLATALVPDEGGRGDRLAAAEQFMFAACTDHVFLDEGHTIDYTNKAFEAVATLGDSSAAWLLPTLVRGTARSTRHEELSEWREPADLIAIAERTVRALLATGLEVARGLTDEQVGALGWALLDEDPERVAAALTEAADQGADLEQLARAVALAAALRLARFHVQNDVGDWDTVHHSFTTANAVHAACRRAPGEHLVAGVVQGALRVQLDRFLNVPAARIPSGEPRRLVELARCWDVQGEVDEAGAIVAGHLASGGDPSDVITELCGVLYREDAGFHWHQTVDAAVRQHAAWPAGSPEGALILVGVTRWLAAHTPTLRQSDQVVTIARRLLRGEAVYEDDDEAAPAG